MKNNKKRKDKDSMGLYLLYMTIGVFYELVFIVIDTLWFMVNILAYPTLTYYEKYKEYLENRKAYRELKNSQKNYKPLKNKEVE